MKSSSGAGEAARPARRACSDGNPSGTRRRAAIGLAIVVAAVVLASCGLRPTGSRSAAGSGEGTAAESGPKAGAPAVTKVTVFPVSVTKATRGAISDYITVSGGIEPAQQVDVYADVAGQLVTLNARLGQFVRRDQVVAEVDPSRPGQNYVPSPVRAPIAGTVTLLPVDLGSRVAQGVPIVQISTIGDLQIRAQIAERYIGVVGVGERARVDLEPYPGVGFPARVVELSPVVDPQTRTMEVTLKLDSPDARVKAGMFAEIKIVTVRKSGIVKVPIEAVVLRGEKQFVFVEGEGNTVARREVATGVNVDGQVEIERGVQAGESVVVRGQTLLEDGSKTKVIEELPALPAADTIL